MDRSRSTLNCEPLVKLSLIPQKVIDVINKTKKVVRKKMHIAGDFVEYSYEVYKKSTPIRKQIRKVKFQIAKLSGKSLNMNITRVHAEFMGQRPGCSPREDIVTERNHCEKRLGLLEANNKVDEIKEITEHLKKLNVEVALFKSADKLKEKAEKKVNKYNSQINKLYKKLALLYIDLRLIPYDAAIEMMNSDIEMMNKKIQDLNNQLTDNSENNEIINKLEKYKEYYKQLVGHRRLINKIRSKYKKEQKLKLKKKVTKDS